MYNLGVKLLNGMKSMYVNSLACVKEDESKSFRFDRGMTQGLIIFPKGFNVYIDTVMKEVSIGMRASRDCLAFYIMT